MAKFRVETELGVSSSGSSAPKVEFGQIVEESKKAGKEVRDLRQAAMALFTAFGATRILTAEWRAFTSAVRESIKQSEAASASMKSIDKTIDELHRTVGDSLAPGLQIAGEEMAKALASPQVQQALKTTGEYIGIMAMFVGDLAAAVIEFVGSPGFGKFLQFMRPQASAIEAEILSGNAWQAIKQHKADVDSIVAAVGNWQKGIAKQVAEEKKAAADRKRLHDEYRRSLQSILDTVDPVAKAEREFAAAVKVLNQALREGDVDVKTYQNALAFLQAELRAIQGITGEVVPNLEMPLLDVQSQLSSRMAELNSEALRHTNAVGKEVSKVEVDAKEAAKHFEEWVSLGRMFADALGQQNNQLGRMLHGVLNIAEAWRAAAAAQTKAQRAQAGAAMGSAVFGVGQAAGVWTGDGGTGAFGGQMSGDYADIGATVGGIIGSIWGPVGTAVGSILGGLLGGAIKKGADEGLATLKMIAGQVATHVYKDEGGLGGVLKGVGSGIAKAVMDIAAVLGGELKSIPDVFLKVRDDIVTVTVAGVKKRFKEVDDAISFAIAEILKNSEISGLDEMMRAALQSASSENIEALQADLEAVNTVISFGLSESQKAVHSFSSSLDLLRQQMVRLLGDSDQLARALGNIAQEEISRWQALRDQITGREMSAAELRAQKEREAMLFNAEKALRIAELQMRVADLEAQKASAMAQAHIYQVGLGLNRDYLDGQATMLEFQSEIYRRDIGIRGQYAEASITLIEAQLTALNQVIGALSAMPDIDMREIRLPNVGNVGGQSGPSEAEMEAERIAQELASLWAQIRSIFEGLSSSWFTKLEQLKHAMYEQIELAHDDADALAAINQAYEAQIAALQNEALQSLGLASVEIIDRFAQLSDTLAFLAERGAIAEAQIRELGDQMFLDLASGLLQYVENEEVRRQLEDLRFRMEMANYELQFQALLALKILTEEQVATIEGLLTGIWDAYDSGTLPFQIPTAPPAPPTTTTGGGEDPLAAAMRALAQAIDRMRGLMERAQALRDSFGPGGSLTSMNVEDQFNQAQADYFAAVAAASGPNATLDQIEAAIAAGELYAQLAGQMLDPSGAGYNAITAGIDAQMAAFQASMQAIIDAAPTANEGVEMRLDTIAQILQQILVLGGGSPGWNPTVQPSPGSYTPNLSSSSQLYGTAGNLLIGGFSSNAASLNVHDSQTFAAIDGMSRRLESVERRLAAGNDIQRAALTDARNESRKSQRNDTAGYIGRSSGGRR